MSAIARKESRRKASVRVGLVGAGAAALALAFALTAKNGLPDYLPGTTRSSVQATFADVGALREGDDVRIADVRVGHVSAITLKATKPVVTLELNGGRPVYSDATATIAARSGLGQKYVELNPGTASTGPLAAGIALARTTSPTELDDVLGALDPKTRALGGSALRELGSGAAGRGEDLSAGLAKAKDLLPDLAKVSDALSEDDGSDLKQLLTTADVLSRSLADQGDQIGATTRQLSRTFQAVATEDGRPLGKAVAQSATTLKALRPALDDLNGPLADTRSAVEALRPGARALGTAMPDLRGFLRESPEVLDEVPAFADDAKPAIDELAPTVEQVQPLVTQVATAFGRASTPLSVMAPYSKEVLLFFQNAASALSQGDSAGRWLRYYPIITPQSFSGVLPVRDPTVSRQAYPAPNEARTHRQGSPLLGEGFH